MQSVYRLHYSFFIFFLLLTILPVAYAAVEVELTLRIVEEGQTGFANDEISLAENETLDLQNFVQTVPDEPKTIGSIDIIITQQVQLVSSIFANPILLENTDLTTVSVSISDQTKILGPATWDKTITPPKTVTTTGTVPAGFVTPTSAIEVGSPDVVLVFNSPVTILLNDVTGQIAYKLSGTNNWVLISSCSGSFATPTAPPAPGECSINNGVDTKIVTFHFTEFGPLEEEPKEEPEPDPTPTPKSSGGSGSGRTGVGPDSASPGQVFVPSFPVLPEEGETKAKLPDWFRAVVFWWAEGKITEEEMNIAMQYLFKIL